jgi:glycosyltransferase involved in cell wall biosynthesis
VLSPASRTLPCPGYPEIRLSLRPGKLLREAFRAVLRRHSYRHRRPDGPGRQPLVPATRPAVHDVLPHALSRIHAHACADPAGAQLRLDALVPQPGQPDPGALTWPQTPAGSPWLQQPVGLARRRRYEPCFGRTSDDHLRLPRPISLYAGPWSPEKNLEAFLDLDLPGSKVVIGDGPALASLKSRHPDAHFLGYRHGEELAEALMASVPMSSSSPAAPTPSAW